MEASSCLVSLSEAASASSAILEARRTAQTVTSNATPVNGYPIAIRAKASQPVASATYNHCWTTNLAAKTAVHDKVATS